MKAKWVSQCRWYSKFPGSLHFRPTEAGLLTGAQKVVIHHSNAGDTVTPGLQPASPGREVLGRLLRVAAAAISALGPYGLISKWNQFNLHCVTWALSKIKLFWKEKYRALQFKTRSPAPINYTQQRTKKIHLYGDPKTLGKSTRSCSSLVWLQPFARL